MLNVHGNTSRTSIGEIIPYHHKLAPLFIRNSLYSLIPEGTEHIYVIGIGSNLISGDSLGPFVGTLLQGLYPEHLTVIGNLRSPLDATTITAELDSMKPSPNSFVITIDSVLGREDLLNTIVVQNRPLSPGQGLGHDFPAIGDCSVMGVVVKKGTSIDSSLLYMNLHLIYTMAVSIAKGISLTIRQYFHYPSTHPI